MRFPSAQPANIVSQVNVDNPVPVTILTGFLGSGKTTLLNYILTERHGLRIAVIENEFGEVDVDSDLVMTSEEEIFQMTNGCICCVVDVRTDLVRILQTLLARPERFDHILVETSGLADPTPVAATFFMDNDVARKVRLDGIVTLVDALHIESHLDDPQLRDHDNQAIDQIVAADRIIVNKTDLVDETTLQRVEQRLHKINEGGQVMRSNHAQVDLTQILGISGFDSASQLMGDPYFLDSAVTSAPPPASTSTWTGRSTCTTGTPCPATSTTLRSARSRWCSTARSTATRSMSRCVIWSPSTVTTSFA